jgi:signal transduction histidine kinase
LGPGAHIEPTNKPYERESGKRAIFEKNLIACFVTSLPFFFIFSNNGHKIESNLVLVLDSIYLICFFLSKKKKITAAKTLFSLNVTVIMFVFAALLGQKAGAPIFFIGILCVQIVFGLGKTLRGSWIHFIGLGLWNYLELNHYQTPIPTIVLPEPMIDMLRLGVINTCYILIFLTLKFLQKENEEFEITLKEQQNSLIASSKLSALGEMAGGIAHEINNPLAIIKILATQMKELTNDENIDREMLKEIAIKIDNTTKRAGEIIQGLKTFSRDGSRDGFEYVQLKKMVDDTIVFCSERFKNNSTTLTVDPIDRGMTFFGQAVQVSQVLLNLLNNSFDALMEKNLSPEERWIRVSAKDFQEFIDIRVIDSGKGIPESVRKKIFQPFFTTKEVGKGTGMGLSVSQGIVHNHRGDLFVDVEAPNTTFVIRIPKNQEFL